MSKGWFMSQKTGKIEKRRDKKLEQALKPSALWNTNWMWIQHLYFIYTADSDTWRVVWKSSQLWEVSNLCLKASKLDDHWRRADIQPELKKTSVLSAKPHLSMISWLQWNSTRKQDLTYKYSVQRPELFNGFKLRTNSKIRSSMQ